MNNCGSALPTLVFRLSVVENFPDFSVHSSMRFQCQSACVRCCEQEGFVYLNGDDIARLAGHLGITRTEFRRRYVCGPSTLARFRKPRRKQCPFLVASGCSVHSVKPLQCNSFPYWPELLADAGKRREAASYCPGMNRGPQVNIATAREIAGQVQRAFPQLYREEP
jgi:Fe-S-cluster containining protein